MLGERRNNKSSISPAHFRGHVGGRSLSRSITIVAEPHNLITAEVRRHPLSRGRLTSQTWMEASQQIAPGTHGRRSFDGQRGIADTEYLRRTYAQFPSHLERSLSRGETRAELCIMRLSCATRSIIPGSGTFRIGRATSIIVGLNATAILNLYDAGRVAR